MKQTRRNLSALLALVLVMALPMSGLASTAYLPRFGVTVNFPNTLDVFTRDMDKNDPVLALYGYTAQQVKEQLDTEGLDVMAIDIAGQFTLTLQVRAQSGSLAELGEQGLSDLALTYQGQEYETFTARGNRFLLVRHNSGRDLACVFLGGGLVYELLLTANTKVNKGMVNLLKEIAGGTDLALGQ